MGADREMTAIIDSHTHYWDLARLNYNWVMTIPGLNRSFLPSDLPKQGDGWRIEKVVFVQAGGDPSQGFAEAEWVSSLAKDDPRISGIVAFAALEKGEGVRASLQALKALPLVKGVRRVTQHMPLGFCAQPGFIEGVRLLPEFGYTCDICVFHPQMPDVLTLVDACPDVRFVLDHVGKPDIRSGLLNPWRDHMRQLAAYPNVMCKLSGMVTEADEANWQPADLQPYIDHVLTCFGTDRVMFGSDAPVVLLASPFERWVETALAATAHLSAQERDRVFYQNAALFYSL